MLRKQKLHWKHNLFELRERALTMAVTRILRLFRAFLHKNYRHATAGCKTRVKHRIHTFPASLAEGCVHNTGQDFSYLRERSQDPRGGMGTGPGACRGGTEGQQGSQGEVLSVCRKRRTRGPQGSWP